MALNCDVSFAGVGDSLEGDPAGIREGAASMTRAGENLGNAARAVNKLVNSSDEIVSKAFAAIGEKAGVATNKLSDAGHRYRRIAEELNAFAQVLETEQANARRLAEAAREAKARRDQAQSAHLNACIRARSMDTDVQQRAVADASQARSRFNCADADWNQAISGIREAANRVAEANNKAASTIETISNVSGLEDSFLDRLAAIVQAVVDTIVKIAKWIWDNIDTICLVLDLVCLVLLCIPGANIAGGALKAVISGVKLLAKGASLISTVKDYVESGQAIVKAIQDPTTENILGAVKQVGAHALGSFAEKKIGQMVEGSIDDIGDAAQDSFLGKFDKAFPKAKENTREFWEDIVEEGTEFGLRKLNEYAIETSAEQVMDFIIPTPEEGAENTKQCPTPVGYAPTTKVG